MAKNGIAKPTVTETAPPPSSVDVPAKLFLVAPPPLDPELVEQILDERIAAERSIFAGFVQCARVVWRKWPNLVEAPEIPPELRAAIDADSHDDHPYPDDSMWSACTQSGIDPLAHNLRELLRPEALAEAQARMQRNIAGENL